MPPQRAAPGSAAVTPEGWSGRVFLGIGGALYVGPAADTGVHRHHAIQVAVGLGRPFRLRARVEAPWRRYQSAVVGSDRSHQLDASGSELAILYLEPEAHAGIPIQEPRAAGGFARLPPGTREALLECLRAASVSGPDPADASRLYRELLQRLHIGERPAAVLDERVRGAIDAVRSQPSSHRSVSDLARRAGLSPRRFRALFSKQLGMSCRQYLLWMRVQAAIREAARGASLTRAAAAAGFADSAHLTRTFRRMFGIAPSSVQRSITLIH